MGILKQIQKKKGRRSDDESPLIIPQEPGSPEGERLLEELLQEGDFDEMHPAPVVRERTATEVLRRVRSGEEDDSAIPPWMSAARELLPAVEALVRKTEDILQTLFPPAEDRVPAAADIDTALGRAETEGSDFKVTGRVRENARTELQKVFFSHGPLDPLYEDEKVQHILINSAEHVLAVREGKTIETPCIFRSPTEYNFFIRGVLARLGRKMTPNTPVVEGVLSGETRTEVSILHPSITGGNFPKVALRIPREAHASFYSLLQSKVLPPTLAAWLADVIAAHSTNILVVGPRRAGKTTMLGALLSAIDSAERAVIIEESPELPMQSSAHERLLASPGTPLSIGELLQFALRRAPTRIVLGEIVKDSAAGFLRALEAGFIGSMSSICAESAEESLWRLLDYVQTVERAPADTVQRRICRSIGMVIVLSRIDDTPCVLQVCEVQPAERGRFIVMPIVMYGGTRDGRRFWKITTESSWLLDELSRKGIILSEGPQLKR